MGYRLSLLTLGPPEILSATDPVTGMGGGKMTALLAYLAMQPGYRHPREALAELLWPDLPLQSGRFNLRHTFFHLREVLGDVDDSNPLLLAGREWLSLNPRGNFWCDTAEFVAGLERPSAELARLEYLAALYRGEFMAGFSLPDCQEFEQWLQIRREDLRRQAAALLEHVAHRFEEAGEFDKALRFALRLSGVDRFNEAGQRLVMRLYALSGQPAAARAQYDSFRALLQDEVGTVPDEETEFLSQQIARGDLRQPDTRLSDSNAAPVAAPIPTERRQVTVLYCELSLADVDDADRAAELLRKPQQSCIDAVTALGGHVTQSHGGALFAYFGYPHAQEGATLSAIAAAHAIIGVAAPASVRCGIHTDTIATSPSLRSPDVAGKASIVAMRLAVAGGQCCVILSQEAYRLVASQVTCRRLPDRTRAAGPGHHLASSMYLLEKIGESGQNGRTKGIRSRFVGRSIELRRLDLLWQQTCSGKPNVVLLRGEPGIGKSRLLSEFIGSIMTLGRCTVNKYACLPQHHGTSFHPFRDLITNTESSVPSAALRDRREKNGRPIRAILNAILSPTAHSPLFVAIEDIHWADSSSLDVIELLVTLERNARAMVVLTSRSEFALPSWAKSTTVIELQQLTAASSRQLTTLLAPSLTGQQAQRVVAKADGVPLFIEELAQWMTASDRSSCIESIPTTLQDLLMARIDKLGTARRLAQVAATIGKNIAPKLLAKLAECNGIDSQNDLPTLLNSGLVLDGNGELRFKHALIQQAAYLSQTLGRRQETHKQVADVLQRQFPDVCQTAPETLAHHLTEAGTVAEAIRYWQLAGDVAAERSGHPEAVVHYHRALDLLGQSPNRLHQRKTEFAVTTALGMQLVLTKGFGNAEAHHCFAQAYDICRDIDDAAQLFPAVHGQWIGAGSYSTYRYAEELTERLSHLAELSGRSDFLLAAHMTKIVTLFWVGRPTETTRHADAVRALALRTDLKALIAALGVDPLVYSLVFFGLSRHLLGHFDDATRLADEALVAAEGSDYADSRCVALTMAAMLHQYLREPRHVIERCEAIDALAEVHGLPLWAAAAKCLRGWSMATQGVQNGASVCLEGLDQVRRNMAGSEAMFGAMYLESLLAVGRHDQVLSDADLIIETAAKRHDGHVTAELYRLKGEALWTISSDNGPAAEYCFRQAFELASRAGTKTFQLRAAVSLFRVTQDRAARDRLRQLVAWFGERPNIPDIVEAQNLLAIAGKAEQARPLRANSRLRLIAA